MRKLLLSLTVLAGAVLAVPAVTASPAQAAIVMQLADGPAATVQTVQYRRDRYYGHRRAEWRHREWRRRHYYRHYR